MRQREKILSYSSFYSIWTLNGLDGVRPKGRGHSALLSLLIQMWISPRNPLTDTPRIRFKQRLGCPRTHTVSHRTILSCHSPLLVLWSLHIHGKVRHFIIIIITWGTVEKIFLCFCTIQGFSTNFIKLEAWAKRTSLGSWRVIRQGELSGEICLPGSLCLQFKVGMRPRTIPGFWSRRH